MPVPDLDSTLAKLAHAASAVTTEEQHERTRDAIEAFRTGHGPELQQQLQDFAADRLAHGTSWLAQQWLDDYLSVRTPLPLTTNVGFQLRIDTDSTGLSRAAELLGRLAGFHLQQAAGAMPPEVDRRGNTMSPQQWECVNGGLRIPDDPLDQVERCSLGACGREVAVIVGKRTFMVPVSDSAGAVLPMGRLEQSLRALLDRAAEPTAGPTLTELSYLGSAALAGEFADVLAKPSAQAALARLRDALFCFSVVEDTAEDSDAELLRRTAFEPGVTWAYKPLTYQVGLDSTWLCLHVEHSTVDGATLVEAIRRVQQTPPPAAGETEALTAQTEPAEELVLELSDAEADQLRAASADYAAEARRLQVAVVRTPRPDGSQLPFKVSADAVAQLILSITQQLTYGRVRAVYEAVDMREYIDGRTECLRAVTPEAVAFAQAVVAGQATQEQLQAALDAHRGWVKSCKSGQAFDRHLWALAFTAAKAGVEPEIAGDEGIAAARTDFLSTTSIGSDAQIVRYAFAPTVPGGFGVNYTPLADEVEYCVSYWAQQPRAGADGMPVSQRAAEFLANLPIAAQKLADFIDELAAD
nr:choline/carnitine O-acyltransferase [Corynebacterium sp. TAE3-ERU12]